MHAASLARHGLLLACVALAGCATAPAQPHRARAVDQRVFVPPPGTHLLVVGQQSPSAGNQRLWLGPAGGVMLYSRLGPVLDDRDEGPGELDASMATLEKRAAALPYSTLQLGLYVVGHLQRVADGKLDANIDRLAQVLIGVGRPVYLRFGYEVDGFWNHHDPAQFRRAWLHFRERLSAAGARNVVMVWHAAADCSGTYQNRPLRNWYPGDAAVDWIGLSWYAAARCGNRPVEEILRFARAHGKPLMIAEATPKGYDLSSLRYSPDGVTFTPRTPDQIWDEWFAPFLAFIRQNADVVRAVSYINDHWDTLPMWGPPYRHGYWGDARLGANPEILARWLVEMRDPRWLRGSPDLFRTLTRD